MGFTVTPETPLKSAHRRRKDWSTRLPPKRYRITIEEAVEAAGNRNRLANHLKITRGAVTQWYPPYRMDPYMPHESARRFMKIKFLRDRLKEIRNTKRNPA